MHPEPPAVDVFVHIRIVMGMVIGLGITRLLTGAARFVQHPGKDRIYIVHLGWVLSLLLMLVHFWWWEFGLSHLGEWTFQVYLFLIGYAILLFLMCTLLFPDNIAEYSGYEEFFISRRRWFFGLLAITFLFDLVDTLIKGRAHFEEFGLEYMIRTPAYVLLCLVAMQVSDRRFHLAFVAASLIYQISFIFRLFDTPN
ncbi:hypothetical protein [Mesorhizobium sp. ZC-5]|jgi:hypothetical protein|uniref:hypothetical protein n=1 Tax=Mesorhizobium sp. ZC-5 TaxID=2986066 RepID=UPI0021E890B4|nr:hypothetical protein [Mesorhizobium sp. ZC-5]MCV3241414.1 hypothetical protein [Mesorhizobium sp. ZC-5]